MLKKNTFLLILIFVLAILPSCRDSSVDDEILKNTDILDALVVENRDSELERYYGDFTPETKYTATNAKDIDGILSPSYTLNDNKYYFEVKKQYKDANGEGGMSMCSYIDLQSGEQHLICSDPLCTHLLNECKYVDLNMPMAFANPNVFYTITLDYNSNDDWGNAQYSIVRIDLNSDSVDIVFRTEEDFTKQYIGIESIYDGKLYFFVTTQYKVEGRKEATEVKTLYTMDLSTHKTLVAGNFPDEYASAGTSILFIFENKFYFQSLQNIFTTDINFENEKIIYTFEENERLGDYFLDTNTKELSFLVRNDKGQTGKIYAYDNKKTKIVDMPNKNIYSYQLTNSKIYYSPYEPIFLGNSPRGSRVYNYTNGKIYVTDRLAREKAELIFDVGRNFNIGTEVGGYIFIGNYMYFPFQQFLNDGVYVWFSSARYMERVRVNLKDNTIRFFDFK